MSYTTPYTPTGQPGSAYPYSTYQHQHPQHLHYPWYGYSYQQVPQQMQQHPARPPAAATQPSTPSASTFAPPLTTTFSSYIPPAIRETSSAPGGSRGSRRQSSFKGLFTKELPKLMYGFGDDKQVSNDTVNVMEEILLEYIVNVCHAALAPTKKNRLQLEDLRRALGRRPDEKKLARMEELLFMQEDIRRARRQFPENELGVTNEVDF